MSATSNPTVTTSCSFCCEAIRPESTDQKGIKLGCGHHFHLFCIQALLNKEETCLDTKCGKKLKSSEVKQIKAYKEPPSSETAPATIVNGVGTQLFRCRSF